MVLGGLLDRCDTVLNEQQKGIHIVASSRHGKPGQSEFHPLKAASTFGERAKKLQAQAAVDQSINLPLKQWTYLQVCTSQLQLR